MFYRLEEKGSQTVLHVDQGDFFSVANGESRYKELSNNGEQWHPILVEINKLMEGN